MRTDRFVVRVSRTLVAVLAVAAATVTVRAASPPPFVDFTGVLTDPSGAPLNGTYNITFRFYDAPAGGNHILTDAHLVGGAGGVVVFGGLHRVALGSGAVSDGAGPGNYTSLAAVFRDYSAVYMEMQIGSETLTGRMRIVSAAYALNADQLDGKDSTAFLDTSSSSQSKSGHLTVNAGLTAASSGYGVDAAGNDAGGYFHDSDSSGFAYVGNGDRGIFGLGSSYGGYFSGMPGGTGAFGLGSTGIQGLGTSYGGYFSGTAMGGYFEDSDNSAYAHVALGDTGIEAFGNETGGYFQDSNASGKAYVATGNTGISAYGNAMGGYFFGGSTSSDYSYAEVATPYYGILGYGSIAGGAFYDLNSSGWAWVGTATSKVLGSGAVSFVQNHPYERDKVIVYAAPEGDEVAVYTRGTAKLENGEARVKLGETFALVANPDVGLTAHLTPRGEGASLFVDELTTSEMVVRGPSGASTQFDYLVYGLRIGFEDKAIVQPKRRESFLPGEDAILEEYGGRSELRSRSALARFETMERAAGHAAAADLSRSRALAAAIDQGRDDFLAAQREAEKASTRADRPERPVPPEAPHVGAQSPSLEAPALQLPRRPGNGTLSEGQATPPAVEQGNLSVGVNAPQGSNALPTDPRISSVTTPGARANTALVPAKGAVEPGDVLVLDPHGDGAVIASAAATDPLVVGCAAAFDGSDVAQQDGKAVLASSGVALCRVDARFGGIAVGDLLVTSPTPGHAMRAGDVPAGAFLGKAAEPLEAGTGLIRVVVTLR